MSEKQGINVDALGANIRLDFAPELPKDVEARVRDVWAAAVTDERQGDVTVTLADEEPEEMLERLSVRVTLAALEHRSGDLLMFHAAGIALPDGGVIAFIGPSGRGKTTLSKNLAKEFGYVSDETVAIDGDLTVLPYRKPLSLKRDNAPKKQVSPDDLGLLELPDSKLRLRRLVILNRKDDEHEPRIEAVALHDVMEDLVSQMSYLSRLSQPLHQLADLCARTGGVVRLNYTEAKSLSKMVPALLDAETAPGSWSSAFAEGEAHESADVATSAGASDISIEDASVLAVGDVLDAIESDGKLIVLTRDRMVRVLSGIGPGVWDAARNGLTVQQAVEQVVGRYGAPHEHDATDLVRDVVRELCSANVLRLASGTRDASEGSQPQS